MPCLAIICTNSRFPRVSAVAARSGDRLLSELSAGTQPWRRRELAFMPPNLPFAALGGTGSVGWIADLRPSLYVAPKSAVRGVAIMALAMSRLRNQSVIAA